jgi:hypothetical protein
MNTTKLEVSKEQAYAISFLDNGGDISNFPNTHKKLHEAIKKEKKRRLMVEIRYLINKSTSFKKNVFKKLKESSNLQIKPELLYKKLDKFTNKQLEMLLQDESKD